MRENPPFEVRLRRFDVWRAAIALVAIGAVATVGQTIYSVFWKSIEIAF